MLCVVLSMARHGILFVWFLCVIVASCTVTSCTSVENWSSVQIDEALEDCHATLKSVTFTSGAIVRYKNLRLVDPTFEFGDPINSLLVEGSVISLQGGLNCPMFLFNINSDHNVAPNGTITIRNNTVTVVGGATQAIVDASAIPSKDPFYDCVEVVVIWW